MILTPNERCQQCREGSHSFKLIIGLCAAISAQYCDELRTIQNRLGRTQPHVLERSTMIDCQLPDNFFLGTGATIVEWSSEVYGWVGLPDDIEYELQLEFPSGEELWLYKSESTGRKFVFWWINFETGSMPDGSHSGNHNFCGLYEITKRKE